MLRVECLETNDAFCALAADWHALSLACPSASVFNSHTWLWNWWQVYGEQSELKLLAVYNLDDLVALLPLYIRKAPTLKLATTRELRLLGSGGDTSPDYLGLLYRPQFLEQSLLEIQKFLRGLSAWDTAVLSDLCDLPEVNQCLQASLSPHAEQLPCASIRYIDLPDSFDGYLASLSSNQRKQVRRRRRRFEELGNTRFFRWPNDRDIDEGFNALAELHRLRWNQKEEGGSFQTDSYCRFHLAVMHALQQRDELRLYALMHEDTMVAMEYSYRWKNGVYSFQCGFHPDYSEHRPGQLLLNYSIEDAIAEGLKQYDMLKGDYDYKASAAKELRNTVTLRAYRNTGAGHLAAFRRDLSKAKAKLRSA